MSNIRRRIAVLFGACLCVLAFSAPAANADVPMEIIESGTHDPCFTWGSGNSVNGNCLVKDIEVELPIYSGQTYAFTCYVTMHMYVDYEGPVYGVPESTWCNGFQRRACTVVEGGKTVKTVWDGTVHALGSSKYELDLDICLEMVDGYGDTTQPITYDLTLSAKSGLDSAEQSSGFPPGWSSGVLESSIEFDGGDAVIISELPEEEE